MSIQRAENVDHQLVRGIGIPALTANIISSTIGAGIFVIPATIATGLGPAAPLAFVCCAIAKQVTNKTIAIAQQTNARGAAGPSPFAIVAGITKIPAPMVELTMFAVSAGMPIPRTSK